jgi:hypothetical protein
MMDVRRRRTMRRLNAAIVAWVLVWAILGGVSFLEVRGLTSLSDTMEAAGQSLQEAGRGLGAVASIPLVGAGVRPTAERVQGLATRTITQAADSRVHIRRLSFLALVVGGVVPIALGVAAYVLLRRRVAELLSR